MTLEPETGSAPRIIAAGAPDLPRPPTEAPLWPHFLAGQAGQPVRVLAVAERTHISGAIAPELMNDRRTLLVGSAETLREGRSLAREQNFDVLLVNAELPDGSGYELITHCRRLRPQAEAIVLASGEEPDDALYAFQMGAAGYLVKHSWFDNMVHAVLQVANGGTCMTPTLTRRLLARHGIVTTAPAPALAPPENAGVTLTGREQQVLRLVANGMTSAGIAGRLAISQFTVDTHMRNACHKLQARTRAQAVTRASELGLL